MTAQKALDRLCKNLPVDNPAWTDEDREYILAIMQALEFKSEAEQSKI